MVRATRAGTEACGALTPDLPPLLCPRPQDSTFLWTDPPSCVGAWLALEDAGACGYVQAGGWGVLEGDFRAGTARVQHCPLAAAAGERTH